MNLRSVFSPSTLFVAFVACGGAVYCAWRFAPVPAITTAAPIDASASSARLTARIAEYVALRKADDSVALYSLVDPIERKGVDLATFLGVYGHGVLRVERLEPLAVTVDDAGRVAHAELDLDAEIVPSKLPDEFRRAFRMPDDPKQLRQHSKLGLDWVLRDREWFFRLDPQVEAQRQAARFQTAANGR